MAAKRSFWFYVIISYIFVIIVLIAYGAKGADLENFRQWINWMLHKVVISGIILAFVWIFKNINKD